MTDTRLERIGRLAAAARGLEREGGYNGAKLLRAALERELVRYAESEAPVGPHAIGDAVEALRDVLEADYPPSYVSRLAVMAAAVRAGSTVPLTDAPAARVCRVCGELFLGDDVPLSCPTCEAPALTFREQLPTWYLEPAEPGPILAALAAGPSHFEAALTGHGDAALARSPAPGEWSARETLQHILFAEELLAQRVIRLLTEDEPDLVPRAVWAETPPSDEGRAETGEPASEILARYRALRGESVARLRELDEAGWGRSGTHPEWGYVTVLSQAAYFARHEASHLAQLVAAAQGRLPGHRA
jgi:hypothetical protein